MKEYLDFMFLGFWHFTGCLILIVLLCNFVSIIWNRFWRHINIMIRGYPPPHCDADGDFREVDKEEVK